MREKIAKWLYESFNTVSLGSWEELPKFECGKQWWLAQADQILTLITEEIEKGLLTDEEISKIEEQWFAMPCPRPSPESLIAQAQLDKALKTDGVLLESDDQSLPDNPHIFGYSGDIAWREGVNDMLKPDSEGRVRKKVIPKEE